MADFVTSLYTEITGAAAISALIGARFYPGLVPIDADLPAVSYHVAGDTPTLAHDGPVGFSVMRVRFGCVGSTYLEAKNVKIAIETFLNGKNGAFGTHTISGARKINEIDTPQDSDALGYQVNIEFMIPWL